MIIQSVSLKGKRSLSRVKSVLLYNPFCFHVAFNWGPKLNTSRVPVSPMSPLLRSHRCQFCPFTYVRQERALFSFLAVAFRIVNILAEDMGTKAAFHARPGHALFLASAFGGNAFGISPQKRTWVGKRTCCPETSILPRQRVTLHMVHTDLGPIQPFVTGKEGGNDALATFNSRILGSCSSS